MARHIGVERKALVRILTDLSQGGMPLLREEDHPQVYWSVPKGWFPGAVAFPAQELGDLVSVLRRAPRSQKRDRLLEHLLARAVGMPSRVASSSTLVTRHLSAEQEARLSQLERAAETRVAIHARYYTRSRGAIGWRHFSVQRILLDGMRFVALCHRDRRLKWFCLDGVMSAVLDPNEPFQRAPDELVEQLLNESVDGYHSGMEPIPCVFRVQLRDAPWVRDQLPLACKVDDEGDDETTFRAITAGLLPLARFLVGLGRAVHIETPELAALVRELAMGALEAKAAESVPSKRITERTSGVPMRSAR